MNRISKNGAIAIFKGAKAWSEGMAFELSQFGIGLKWIIEP